MKVVVLGATGMFGFQCWKTLESFNYNVIPTARNKKGFLGFSAGVSPIHTITNLKPDYVINGIGIIKPYINVDKINSIYVNSIFPRELSNACESNNIRLINITTDCCFSSKTFRDFLNYYTEEDYNDPLDFYGKTKSLGEPENCMNLRVSIIGEEQYHKSSLIEWVKQQRGQINGFTNHYWNGLTTKQLAECIHKIIQGNFYDHNAFHLFSPNVVTKYELVNLIANKFKVPVEINKFEDNQTLDRTLSTVKQLNTYMDNPKIEKQIELL